MEVDIVEFRVYSNPRYDLCPQPSYLAPNQPSIEQGNPHGPDFIYPRAHGVLKV